MGGRNEPVRVSGDQIRGGSTEEPPNGSFFLPQTPVSQPDVGSPGLAGKRLRKGWMNRMRKMSEKEKFHRTFYASLCLGNNETVNAGSPRGINSRSCREFIPVRLV